jgi:hypothetical protein
MNAVFPLIIATVFNSSFNVLERIFLEAPVE